MKDNFDQCLALLLKHEGGYVNHPADPGGRTNLGVTQRVWEEYVGHPVTEADMRALGPKDVAPLYKQRYWDAVRGDVLPTGVDYSVFDIAVNSGVGRAAKILQKAIGVAPDGAIGPATLGAVSESDPAELIISVCRARQAFLEGLPTFSTFGKGWTRRVNEVQAKALAMHQEPELPLTRSNV